MHVHDVLDSQGFEMHYRAILKVEEFPSFPM